MKKAEQGILLEHQWSPWWDAALPFAGTLLGHGVFYMGTHFPKNRGLHVPALLYLKSNDENLSKIYNDFLLSLVKQRKHKVYLFPF